MSLLLSILLGVIVGGVGGYLLMDNLDSLIINIVFGVAGSLLGMVMFIGLGSRLASDSLFSWTGTVCSLIGAMTLVLLFNGLQRLASKSSKSSDAAEDTDPDQG